MGALISAQHLTHGVLLLLGHLGWGLLRIAPIVEYANLVDALKGASWRTPFLRIVFPIKIIHRVLLKWNARITALLRTPVDKAVLADVEIPRARSAAPVVGLPFGYAVLKPIQSGMIFITELLHLLKNLFLSNGKRLQSSIIIVNDSHGSREF